MFYQCRVAETEIGRVGTFKDSEAFSVCALKHERTAESDMVCVDPRKQDEGLDFIKVCIKCAIELDDLNEAGPGVQPMRHVAVEPYLVERMERNSRLLRFLLSNTQGESVSDDNPW